VICTCLVGQSINTGLAENQLMSGMVTEPEGRIPNNQLMIASIRSSLDQGAQNDIEEGHQRRLLNIWN
jgi:hypothetical protein